MNIVKTQNVSFNGTVHLEGQAKSYDPILRPLIHHLKYNCGNKNFHHFIDVSADNCIQLKSVYHSKTRGAGGFSIILDGRKKKNADYVKELIRKTDLLNLVYRVFKNEQNKILDLRRELEDCKRMLGYALKRDAKIAKEPKSFFEGLAVFLAKNKNKKIKK